MARDRKAGGKTAHAPSSSTWCITCCPLLKPPCLRLSFSPLSCLILSSSSLYLSPLLHLLHPSSFYARFTTFNHPELALHVKPLLSSFSFLPFPLIPADFLSRQISSFPPLAPVESRPEDRFHFFSFLSHCSSRLVFERTNYIALRDKAIGTTTCRAQVFVLGENVTRSRLREYRLRRYG